MRHQELAYRFCLEHPRAGLLLGMGLGKTVVSLTVLARRLWDEFSVRKALVIAPKNVARNVWAQECAKWDHLRGIRCSLILGTAAQRRAALAAEADLYIINRDNVVWLMGELGGRLPFEMIILDELSSFKSTSAKRWKVLKKPIQTVPYVLGLTGTPAPNGYLDLWPQVYLLDGGKLLGRTIGSYRDRYFRPGAHKGHVVYEWLPRIGAREAIDRELRSLCLSMRAEDWLTLPPVIYNTVTVAMDRKARATYDRMKQEKVIPLLRDGETVEQLAATDEELDRMNAVIRGDTAATVAGKLLQMANGAVYDDARAVVEIHGEKLDALEEYVEATAGENLLVFYTYQHDRERILRQFPQARVFTGAAEEQDWNAGKIPMLLCHPASCGHGLNLQMGGHRAVWFGLTWSLELYQQANARLPRPGQTQSVIITHIVCRDTLDEQVLESLQEKNESQAGLLKALRRYITKEEETEA